MSAIQVRKGVVLLLQPGRHAFQSECYKKMWLTTRRMGYKKKYLSTSSLSIMNSFFKTLIANSPFVFFSSANMTLPKFPFPSTAKKLKSSRPTFLFLVVCLGGGCTGCVGTRCCRGSPTGDGRWETVEGGKVCCFVWVGPWGRGLTWG